MQCQLFGKLRPLKVFVTLSLVALSFSSCSESQDTPSDTKYLEQFHRVNFEQPDKPLAENKLNLYVDYSTCCAMGQYSQFFQDVAASLVNRTTPIILSKVIALRRKMETSILFFEISMK